LDSASDGGCSSRSAERTNLRMATTSFCNSTVINNNSCCYSTSGEGGGARNYSVSYSSQSSTSSSSTDKTRKARCGRLGLLGRVCQRPWSASAASTLCSGFAAAKESGCGGGPTTARRIPRSRSALLLTPPHEQDELGEKQKQQPQKLRQTTGNRSRKRVNVIENPRESSPMPWARKASSRSRHFQKFLRLKRSRSMSELKIAL
jgi:hypothetical protein